MNGRYSITLKTPFGVENGSLELSRTEHRLTAFLQLKNQRETLHGRATSDTGFEFEGTRKWMFRKIDYVIQGEIQGDQLKGTLESALGTMTFQGSRLP